jgi:Protein kinase domain
MADDARDAPTKPDVPASVRRQGYTLGERFEHLREIARGGMGRVVEARDRHLDRIVAVKESLDDHPDSLLRFEREVAITARLEHPSIVPVYDAGIASDGMPFYVMRRVSGVSLDRLIDKATTLDKRLPLLRNVLAVAEAIAHAHQRGVIHRDIKPSNVLVGELGETVVIDWGLAKMIDDDELPGTVVRERGTLETAAGAVIGTPGFMAPEQVTAGTTDARSDVYALGACLYYLLAGKTPFHGSAEDEVLERTRAGALDPLDKAVPEELVTIVKVAMATDPAQRYLDAGGLSEELRRFLAGQLVASHRYSPLERSVRWISRHRTAAVAIAGVAIAAAVAVVLVRRLGTEQARTATKADDVLIVQASELVATDPTRAIALLKQLRPDSPRWATLAPLVADARARGIADGYPGHTHFDQIEFNRDPGDHRVLSVGFGVARVTDLAARTSKVVAEGPTAMRAFWCGALVLHNPTLGTLRLVDSRTGAKHDIVWPEEVSAAAAAHGIVAFIDAQHRTVTLDAPVLPITAEPVLVPGATDAKYVGLSLTGQFLLVYRETSTLLYQRDNGWKQLGELPAMTTDPQFADREDRIVFRDDTTKPPSVVERELPSLRELRRWPVTASHDLAYIGTKVYSAAAGVITRLDDPYEVGRSDSPSLFTIARAGGWLAILEAPRRITFARGSIRRTIRSPVDLQAFAADPAGNYVVGIGGGMLLAWNLAPVLPRALPIAAEQVVYRDGGSILTTNIVGMGRRVDNYRFTPEFQIKAEAQLGQIPIMGEIYILPGGVIAARDMVKNIEVAFDPPLLGRTDLSALNVIDANAFLIGTTAGSIERVPTTGAPTVLGKLDAAAVWVTTAGDWTAAQTAGGELWRSAAGKPARTKLTNMTVGIEVTRDGTVYVGSGNALIAWHPSGELTPVADFGNTANAIRTVVGGRIAVITRDHSLHLYEPATQAARLVSNGSFDIAGLDLDISEDGTLAASRIERGLSVVQLATGARWSLADRIDARAVALSTDARYLIASDQSEDVLYRFDVTLPPATAAWVKQATTARSPRSPTAALEWASP